MTCGSKTAAFSFSMPNYCTAIAAASGRKARGPFPAAWLELTRLAGIGSLSARPCPAVRCSENPSKIAPRKSRFCGARRGLKKVFRIMLT